MAANFQKTQDRFAGYIRDPQRNAPPDDVEPRRMAMYRELFFNNIDSFIASNFPVIRTLLNEEQWFELTQDFFAKHRNQTPYFSEIAEEFLDYLQNERSNPHDYPFLLELAHYEWVEMALSIAKDAPNLGDSEFLENLWQRPLALSPLAWPLLYRFPVQAISPEFLPLEPPDQPTCLIVYRDSLDSVHFLKTTGLTLELLQILQDQGAMTGEQALQTLTDRFPQIDAQSLLDNGPPMLRELAEKGILIPPPDA